MTADLPNTDLHLDSILDALECVLASDGKRGIGIYHMPILTWCAFTRRPAREGKNTAVARAVAVTRLQCICAALNYTGMKPDARRVALCWRFGIEVAAHFRVPSRSQERWAFRVSQKYRQKFLETHLAKSG